MIFCDVCCLPCDVCCDCDELKEDIDGLYGGKLIFDKIFTPDELRLLAHSPSEDGDSVTFEDDDTAFL